MEVIRKGFVKSNINDNRTLIVNDGIIVSNNGKEYKMDTISMQYTKQCCS